ncbi:hypothetical protein POM88_043061 [Heracleum sosnowskyi]|uniref:Uncharacterized protein n=1 Tax=Heracleum sosnowskyi TaxID=360622 RepID=A0AAD8H2N8_9APIA|nr:hypothetical protein POM88_043061 [Heracleum sosnowskyi]
MPIPAHVGDNSPNVAQMNDGLIEGVDRSESKNDELVKIDPYGRNWGLRFLELELSNLTGVVFEIRVPVQLESCNDKNTDLVDDDSFLAEDYLPNAPASSESSSLTEKNMKAELNASIKNLISRIKVRSQSGRNRSVELNFKDTIQTAFQTSVIYVLLPDPMAFGFRIAKSTTEVVTKLNSAEESDVQNNSSSFKGSVVAHDMTPMEVLILK